MKNKSSTTQLLVSSIGLILSIIFSLIYAPNTYAPLSYDSPRPSDDPTSGSRCPSLPTVLLSGRLSVFSSTLETAYSAVTGDMLRATLTHFFLMLAGFVPLATLAGWFPFHWIFYLQLILEFAIVYLIIWAILYKEKLKK